MKTTSKPKIFRLAVSPVDGNCKIGPLRTHLLNYLFANHEKLKEPSSKIFYKIDNTNEQLGNDEKAADLYRFFTQTMGFQFDPTNDQGDIFTESQNQDIYKTYLKKLESSGMITYKGEIALLNLEVFASLYGKEIVVTELLRGDIKFDLNHILKETQNSFPLTRSDGSVLYHLASVVDDHLLGVTHVVRGADKISILPYQEILRIALEFEPKSYLHTPLFLNQEGSLLKGKTSYYDFLENGISHQTLLSYLISSGYGDPDALYTSLEEAALSFDCLRVHKNNNKFSQDKLSHIQKLFNKRTKKILSSISEGENFRTNFDQKANQIINK